MIEKLLSGFFVFLGGIRGALSALAMFRLQLWLRPAYAVFAVAAANSPRT